MSPSMSFAISKCKLAAALALLFALVPLASSTIGQDSTNNDLVRIGENLKGRNVVGTPEQTDPVKISSVNANDAQITHRIAGRAEVKRDEHLARRLVRGRRNRQNARLLKSRRRQRQPGGSPTRRPTMTMMTRPTMMMMMMRRRTMRPRNTMMMTRRPTMRPKNGASSPKACRTLPDNSALDPSVGRVDGGVLTASDKQKLLDKHNDLRSLAALGKTGNEPMATDMTELVWDDGLAASSASYASQCKFAHPGGDFGENLYASASSADNVDNLASLLDGTQDWFDEHEVYTYGTLGGSDKCVAGEQCGHYTQVVWADTLKVGCGYAECRKKIFGWDFEIIMVCRYSPPGNWVGNFPYTRATSSAQIATNCPSGYSPDASSGLCKLPCDS